ncbi:disco-interacting protein 2 homolog B-A [Seriola lalandi dorsalis]|uniref:disco-interacting protein 2 homolog B-A n=1 Tax=Seriola lalandi dorsalis TaxID=1841481 RepID=UPI000C6F5814|nr:disco-interacting protein 2 homolog B-A [Seriola lalandi dorsalis]
MADRGVDLSALPKEVRDQLAELDLELSEGDITQKGYEKKKAKLLASYIPHLPNVDLSLPDVQLSPGHSADPSPSPEAPGPSTSSASRHHRTHRSGGARDDRYRSDIHTEAVQAALAKHKEEKMALPMPTKRRSAFVQSPIDTCTPPDTSSASEDEGSLRRKAALSAVLAQSLQSPDYWINRSVQSSSTSSSASSTLSHGEPKTQPQPQLQPAVSLLADVLAHTRIENSVPPDVTSSTPQDRGSRVDLPPAVRGMSRGQSRSSMLDTADGKRKGVPVNSRVSTKIQQLLNTLKRPKRPPLSEFFLDDSEEIVEVQHIDQRLPYERKHKKTSAKTLPGARGAPLPARAILSMGGLSHGVIRVNTEDKNSALTVQDVGHIMPGALMCIVKPDGPPQLCKTDEIGEIVINSRAGGTMYYGLPGVTKNTFEVIPVNQVGAPIGEIPFTRTGLLGFVGPGSLVFVVGKIEGLLMVSGRRHNADDLVATALAVEPVKTVYRGRIAVFSVTVFYDERIVIVAEQRPDASEEDSFQWMSRVLQAIDSIHQVGLYCLALVPANTLPKTPLGGIHICETKQNFLEGNLHPCNILMCPHTCVTNLPKPRQKQPVDVGPASMLVGNLVAGKRIAQATGRELGVVEDQDLIRKHQFLSEALQWRAQTDPDHVLYVLLNAKGVAVCTATCAQLHKRAEKITATLMERGGLNTGDNVVLLYPPGIDLIAAFYGCLYAGVIPVTVRPPHPQNLAATLPTVRMIIDVSKAACILTTQPLMRILRSREAAASVNIKTWPTIIDTDDLPRKRPPHIYKPPTAEMLAYLDFSVSTTGMLTGVKMSHAAVSTLCRSIKLQCELYSSRQIAICLDPYCGLGFVLWCLSSVYSGHQSILIPPLELESSLPLWLSTLSQYKIRDTFCSYSVMELCTKGLGTQTEMLKARGLNLSCVRSCVVIAEERPRLALTQSFSKLFKDLGLSPRAVSTAFGSRVNLAICLQGTAGPDPSTVYVDMKSLRHDRVRLVERGAPQSLPLMESGTILPGVRVIIVNPETRGPLGDSHLGEIWVNSPHSASGYYTIYGEEGLQADHFNTRLSFGEPHTLWARTGYLGFIKRTELLDASGDRHDALFVVGSLDETLELRGLRYHPIDIETSVSRAHRSIAESAVFTWTNLLVVVAELSGSEQEALDLVPLVTNVVLEEHHLIVGVVVIVDPGVIPINSRGEKQRMHLRDSFLADQLDPIYVAYNM